MGVRELDTGGMDFNQAVLVAHRRLFILTEYDRCSMVHLSFGNKVDTLPSQGMQRSRFSTFYSVEQDYQFIYVIGGADVEQKGYLSDCMKFNIYNYTWTRMPFMKFKREGPGVIMSKDAKYLYAFGGRQNNVERLDLTDYYGEWKELIINLPSNMAQRGGFTMFPMWTYPDCKTID